MEDEQIIVEPGSAGSHTHPEVAHEHPEIFAELIALREEVIATALVQEAEEAASASVVAAEVAIDESLDTRAEVQALRDELVALKEMIGLQAVETVASPAVVESEPVMDEPPVEAPPVAEHKPHRTKKQNPWW
jgi:hypothetical protein